MLLTHLWTFVLYIGCCMSMCTWSSNAYCCSGSTLNAIHMSENRVFWITEFVSFSILGRYFTWS